MMIEIIIEIIIEIGLNDIETNNQQKLLIFARHNTYHHGYHLLTNEDLVLHTT